ncbi:MAG: BNR repeat-containing protein [Phycisphaerae bacterium]|nr:BNR repeat-containing protein [Phycisphaerae bacterium]
MNNKSVCIFAVKVTVLLMAVAVTVCQGADQVDKPKVTMSAKPSITLVDEGLVAPDGLWLTRKVFGRNLSAHGDCIKVHKGYIYVTWYQGGMDNRTVCLSRKKIGGKEWKHIKFPHRHVLFRKDKDLPENKRRGDTHNTIAIGICPRDDTIHLLYDMHAATPKDFPKDYFNYSYSKKGAAVAEDEKWGIDLFYPKQNYLSKEAVKKNRKTYHRVTYPIFLTTDDGDLLAKWRVGGTLDAIINFSKYDGKSWSAPWLWNYQKGKDKVGIYGSYRIFNGRLYTRWMNKLKKYNSKSGETGIVYEGPFMAYCMQPGEIGAPWYGMDGKKYSLPIKDLEPFRATGSFKQRGKGFVITPGGAFHTCLAEGEEKNSKGNKSSPAGDMFILGDRVYSIGLENWRPVVKSTRQGTDEWKVECRVGGKRRYRSGVTFQYGNSLFYYLVDFNGVAADAKNLRVLRFDINPKS